MSQALGVRLWRSFQLRDTNLRITCVREETWRKHRHSKTGQRRNPNRDARVSFPSWLQVPSALHLPSDGIWGFGISSMHGKDPAYIRVSFYLNMAFFSWLWPPRTSRTTVPVNSLLSESQLRKVTQILSAPGFPNLPGRSPFFLSHPVSLLYKFQSIVMSRSLVFLCLSHQVVPPAQDRFLSCFALFPLVWQETATHHGVSFIFPTRWLSLSTLL